MGLSVWQILIIVGVILLLFGANRIPRMMRDLGSGVTQFKKGLKDNETADGDDEKPAIENAKSVESPKQTSDKPAQRT